MVLHPALEVKVFYSYGFPCRGLFVKSTAADQTVTTASIRGGDTSDVDASTGIGISKGEPVWWFDSSNDAAFRTYTKHAILAAPTSIAVDAIENYTPGTGDTETTPPVINLREQLITYAYMLDDDTYSSKPCQDEDVSYYYNHSCTANTAYKGDDLIVALRDILPGEQVVYDYAFTETQDSMHAGMHCKCGTPACRGTLDFLQYKDPSFIAEHYDHCTTFIQRKMRENGWVHDHVVRRRVSSPSNTDSSHGDKDEDVAFGLFACAPIPALTLIAILAGKIVSGKYIETAPRREQELCFQIDSDTWQVPNRYGGEGLCRETGDFINHSCNPNCGMMDGIRIVTMRDIQVDEALTIDYAMVNTGLRNIEGKVFTCLCGGPDVAVTAAETAQPCRGTITPLDYQKVGARYFSFLSPHVREAYGKYCEDYPSQAVATNGAATAGTSHSLTALASEATRLTAYID